MFCGSLALVTDHFEISHFNIACFSGFVVLVLSGFTAFLLGGFWPERPRNRYLMTEMLRQLYSPAAKPIDFPILSGDGILSGLVTLLQASCDGRLITSRFFLCARARL